MHIHTPAAHHTGGHPRDRPRALGRSRAVRHELRAAGDRREPKGVFLKRGQDDIKSFSNALVGKGA